MRLQKMALVALVCRLGCAATYYVANTGSDAANGSATTPWKTLQWAVDHIGPGDTALVQPGTYAGCRIGNPGLAGAVKTLKANGAVLLNAPGAANKHNSIVEVENFSFTMTYWVIDGFEVTSSPKYGIDVRVTQYITVQNNKVHDSALTGIFTAFSNNVLIQNNVSYNNHEHGIYQSNSSSYPTIQGNTIYGNTSAGIHMNGDLSEGAPGIVSHATVVKNVIYQNGTGGASGINCDGVDYSLIANNLLYSNYASGISLYAIDAAHGSSHNMVYNNTIVMPATSRWAINIPASSGKPSPVGNQVINNILYVPTAPHGSVLTYGSAVSGFVSDHNVVVNRFSVNGGNTTITLSAWRTKTKQDLHSILVSDPTMLFVNFAGNDFRLKAGSPAVNAGATLSQVTDDIVGTARPQGGAYDIGAYESF